MVFPIRETSRDISHLSESFCEHPCFALLYLREVNRDETLAMLQKVEASLLAALTAEQTEDSSARLTVLLKEVRAKLKEIGE